MENSNQEVGNIIEKIAQKGYFDMNKDEKEWAQVCVGIVAYIMQKYDKQPDIIHLEDAKNTKNHKLPDFKLLESWIEEFPRWHYELTQITGEWNRELEVFNDLITQDLLFQKLDERFASKAKKNYIAHEGVRGLVLFSIVGSSLKPLDVIRHLKNKNGNFDVMVFAWFINEETIIILIYNRTTDCGYYIHMKDCHNRFEILKDEKVDFNLLSSFQ